MVAALFPRLQCGASDRLSLARRQTKSNTNSIERARRSVCARLPSANSIPRRRELAAITPDGTLKQLAREFIRIAPDVSCSRTHRLLNLVRDA
jgi:hypothetical protein